MEILRRPGAYEQIFATGRRLMEGLSELLKASGLPGQVIGVPPLFDIVFASGEIADYRATLKGDAEMQKRVTRLLRSNGVLKGDSKFYVSLAHEEADIRHTLDAFAASLRAAAA
jgi:glutamate-1-semialdehyde 2,1-aminomutase